MKKILYLILLVTLPVFSQSELEKLKLMLNTSTPIDRAEILIKIGLEYDNEGKYDDALQSFYSALSVATTLNEKKIIASAISSIGMIHDTKGDYDLALKKYFEAGKIFENSNYEEGEISVKLRIGHIYLLRSSFDSAFAYINNCLVRSKLLKNNKLIAESNYEMGAFNYRIKKYDQALVYFTEAKEFNKVNSDIKLYARSFGYSGLTFQKLKQYDKALEQHSIALKIRTKANEVAGIASSYNNIGDVYQATGKYQLALESYNRSIEIRGKIGGKYGKAETQTSLGITYLSLNQPNKAIPLFLQSLDFALKSNLIELQSKNYLNLSNAYRSINNPKLAYQYYDKYSDLKEVISLEEYNTKYTFINIKLANLEKEKGIQDLKILKTQQTKWQLYLLLGIGMLGFGVVLLHRRVKSINEYKAVLEEKNSLISKQNIDLENLNKTKDNFFSIIGHDLKNPFTSIIGFTDLLIEDFDSLDTNDQLYFIKEINSSSRSTFQLLENLLQWSKSQMGKIEINISQFNLSDVINEVLVITKPNAEKKHISINLDFNDNILVNSDKNIISTVLRNLVSNAIKYTKRLGKVDISVLKEGTDYRVCVSDNGIGIKEVDLRNLFIIGKHQSVPGTDKEKGTGLGLILCNDFLELIDSKLDVSSEVNFGTTFTFLLKDLKK